jgi:hypothetical protein
MKITHGNILAVFFSANAAEIEEGMNWYERAQFVADRISEECGISVIKVSGVIAALSPNNRWNRNITDAQNLCRVHTAGCDVDTVKVSTFGRNREKAVRILNGEDVLEVLGGLKVRSFFNCIIGDWESVCVDGHAYSIWLGERIPTTKTPRISESLYYAIADDYRKAAMQINGIMDETYSPAQIQAITWVTWRNLHKRESK